MVEGCSSLVHLQEVELSVHSLVVSRPLMRLPSLGRLKLKLDLVTADHLGPSKEALWESTKLTQLLITGPPEQMLSPQVCQPDQETIG